MPNPTLREIVETFTEEELSLTVPIEFQDVSLEDYPYVNEYNRLLASAQASSNTDEGYNAFQAAYEYRLANQDKIDKYIIDAKKLNILTTLVINAYMFAKGEKSAENTSYDNSVSGLEATNLQKAVDEICEEIGVGNNSEGSLSERVGGLENDVGGLENDLATFCTLTQKELTKINDKLPFSFGIDENGNYGYIKEGADTVTPFSEVYRQAIVSSLLHTGLIKSDSTWDEIILALNLLFPETFNLLTTYPKKTDNLSTGWKVTGSKSGSGSVSSTGAKVSCSAVVGAYAKMRSPNIDITNFNTLTYSVSKSYENNDGNYDGVKLVGSKGEKKFYSGDNNKHLNISDWTGDAYITMATRPNYPEKLGGSTPVADSCTLYSCVFETTKYLDLMSKFNSSSSWTATTSIGTASGDNKFNTKAWYVYAGSTSKHTEASRVYTSSGFDITEYGVLTLEYVANNTAQCDYLGEISLLKSNGTSVPLTNGINYVSDITGSVQLVINCTTKDKGDGTFGTCGVKITECELKTI